MSHEHDLDPADALVPGSVGPAGQRVFYLQVHHPSGTLWFRLEKQQVAALANFLDQVATGLGAPEEPAPLPPFTEPGRYEWIVGGISVGLDDRRGRIVVIGEELGAGPEDSGSDPHLRTVRITLEPAAARGFVRAAHRALEGGRPACPLCEDPIDSEGHWCPRMN